jgi:hypothetical protein
MLQLGADKAPEPVSEMSVPDLASVQTQPEMAPPPTTALAATVTEESLDKLMKNVVLGCETMASTNPVVPV